MSHLPSALCFPKQSQSFPKHSVHRNNRSNLVSFLQIKRVVFCWCKQELCHWFLCGSFNCVGSQPPANTGRICSKGSIPCTVFSVENDLFFLTSGSMVPYPNMSGTFLIRPCSYCHDFNLQTRTTWSRPHYW